MTFEEEKFRPLSSQHGVDTHLLRTYSWKAVRNAREFDLGELECIHADASRAPVRSVARTARYLRALLLCARASW